jgi:anaerobic selenocysteine-containing dehydrogenase
MARAAAILNAITGNIDVPGGLVRPAAVPLMKRKGPQLELWDRLNADWQETACSQFKMLPTIRYLCSQNIITGVLDEKPYPLKVLYIQGCNPLVTYPNAKEVLKAVKKVDFIALADLFMTPTAAMADIVLPAASYLEYDSIWGGHPMQKVAHLGQCKSDYEIISALAQKLGLGDYFWDSQEECLDYLLTPASITFDQLRKQGKIETSVSTAKTSDYPTPSGKIELYSNQLEQWGYDPLPSYHELPETPYSKPDLAKEYPLVLTTWKSAPYRHSGGRQIEVLRMKHPDPVVSINTEKANELGINDGDWVFIENERGRIKQKATLSNDIDARVVIADYGWWFPEKDSDTLYGWSESNINVLTDNNPPYSPELGSCNMRGILCKIYKA